MELGFFFLGSGRHLTEESCPGLSGGIHSPGWPIHDEELRRGFMQGT